jgi:hypothetical protein
MAQANQDRPLDAAAAPAAKPKSFYIGYNKAIPLPLRPFLMIFSAVLVVVFTMVALLISRNINDPGNGDYDADLMLTGTLIASPAPILRVAADAQYPHPHALMLTGEGKEGVPPSATALAGKHVTISGTILRRGSIDMLVTAPQSIRPAPTSAGPVDLPGAVSLGRWRLSGEICDGKCMTGAMRPGTGLAHKACANLCIFGGIPPVFVSTSPVDGVSFFLLTGTEGAALPQNLYNLTALRVEIEGEILKLDDLLILQTDLKTARKL